MGGRQARHAGDLGVKTKLSDVDYGVITGAGGEVRDHSYHYMIAVSETDTDTDFDTDTDNDS